MAGQSFNPRHAPTYTFQRPAPFRDFTDVDESSPELLSPAPSRISVTPDRGAALPDTRTSFLETPSLGRRKKASFGREAYKNRLSPDEIRLVVILPSKWPTSTVECNCSHFELDSLPTYTALSYAWGDRRDATAIVVGGESLEVTTSLRDALTALRRRDVAIRVWADALCINQSDVQELNQQVQIMDRIYEAAESVAVWLGPKSVVENSRLAIQYLQATAVKSKAACGISEAMPLIESEESMIATVRLFERDYWKRLWIMQEVFYARKIKVFCGADQIDWDDITSANRFFNIWKREIDEKYPPGGSRIPSSRSHYSYAHVLTTQGPNGLFDPSTRTYSLNSTSTPLKVMRGSRGKLAARPQDKVLGISSLLPANIRLACQPDFQLTPVEVFTDMVVTIIVKTRRLDIICETIHYPFHQDTFGLPSWVPDWSYAPDTLSLAATRLSHRRTFRASGGRKWVSKSPEEDEDVTLKLWQPRNELAITGIQLGAIGARGAAVGTLGRLTNYLMAFLEWRHLLTDKFCVGDPAVKKEKFCRTLCTGNIPDVLDLGDNFKMQRPQGSDADDVVLDAETKTSLSTSSGDTKYRLKRGDWAHICYHAFSIFFGSRLESLPLDPELQEYQRLKTGIDETKCRQALQEFIGDRMMGRCFCLIRSKIERVYMGMGTGYMGIGDLVVVPLGCSTPIIIRPTGSKGRYQFIGDIYVDEFMDGEALEDGELSGLEEFVLC